ncbi:MULTISPECIES: protein bicaudal D homolog [Janthinobacterium]|uniref:protein bicaudal D homolog n=1 Tax=Janthinobacterium TaxID=29580 RepID=UPI00214AB69E|nr:protein bicaudal D homolog [Janthinobacterium sp. UMAB-60]
MMTRTSLAGMAACALLLGACAAKPTIQTPVLVQTPPRVVVVADPQLTELLAYQSALRLMTPSELVKAQLDLAKADHAPSNTIRRAMLQATVRGAGDLARAQALLEPLATAKDGQLLAPLAQLLSSQYAELRRQDESIDKLNAQLRDAQRRNEQLNEKLEALKNIERSLSVRPAAGAPK